MLAIQPPEYFPRLSTFALIMHVDHFVLADTFRYRRQTFQNRSKLRNPNGWQWIAIPLFGSPDGRPIAEVPVELGSRWREKHWRSFLYNYRSTMYFEQFADDLEVFFEADREALGAWTCGSVELLARGAGVQTRLTRASALEGAPDTPEEILQAVCDAEPGAHDVLLVPDGEAADAAPEATARPDGPLEVRRFRYDHPTYRQNFSGFEAGMSAADILCNYGPQAQRTIGAAGTVVDAQRVE
jgi:hypothetical protein